MQGSSAVNYFLCSAARVPSRTAVELGSWSCTYSQLSLASARIAAVLRQSCIGDHDIGKAVIAVNCPRGPLAYAAVLGIMRAGAAYVYLDPDFPDDRADFILQDCAAKAKITQTCTGGPASMLLMESGVQHSLTDIWRLHDETDEWQDLQVSSSDLAYLIYTSGSTGKPKGVLIEHGSLCTLIEAERKLYGVVEEDRILQGFSLAFDASVEELWMAWAAGAALVVGTPDIMHLGPDLGAELSRMGITVLSTVPTLLKTMDDPRELSVRILILGGEALTQPLVNEWAPGRQMFNTYGPTEATVICTATQVEPGRTITIGTGIEGYDIYVLDEQLEEVLPAEGAEGQLAVGGRAVARGYLNRPEATEKSFIEHPSLGRLYLTGDIVRWTQLGARAGTSTGSTWEYGYVGRSDTQVKIRGFRVELGEIERSALDFTGLTDVAVVAVAASNGEKKLYAFATGIKNGVDLENHLRSKLPPAWIPSVEVLDELPVLQASGKVDRKELAGMVQDRIQHHQTQASQMQVESLTDLDGITNLLMKVAKGLGVMVESADDDFFDCGGTSVAAASFVSQLRNLGRQHKMQALEYVSVRQLYECRTMGELASSIECDISYPRSSLASSRSILDLDAEQYYIVAVLQFLWIFFELALCFTSVLAVSIGARQQVYSMPMQLLAAVLLVFAAPLLIIVMSVFLRLVKLILCFKAKPGKIQIWSLRYFRWWVVHHIQDLIPTFLLAGTPFAAWWARFMGAKIGKGVVLWQVPKNADLELLSIGDGASVGQETFFNTAEAVKGQLLLGEIHIGAGASIGSRVNISPHTSVGEGAIVEDLTHVSGWLTTDVEHGIDNDSSDESFTAPLKFEGFGFATSLAMLPLMTFLLSLYCFVLPFMLHGMIAGVLGWTEGLSHVPRTGRFVIVTLTEGFFWQLWAVVICILSKWLIVGRLREGSFNLSSLKYLRFWFMQGLMQFLSGWLLLTNMTVYYPWVLWLLGARIGSNCEFGQLTFGLTPDILNLGADIFLGDHTCVGPVRIHCGVCELQVASLADRCFVANNAVVPACSKLEEGVVIGAQSRAPQQARSNSAWLGVPAIELVSSREQFKMKQSCVRKTWRFVWDLLRTSLTFSIFIAYFFCYGLVPLLLLEHEQEDGFQERITLLSREHGVERFWTWLDVLSYQEGATSHDAWFWLGTAAWGPVSAMGLLLTAVLLKWVTFCRTRAGIHNVHSCFMDLSNLYFGVRALFYPWISLCYGTPLICLFFRLQGARVGSRVFMHTSQLSEPDLISIGSRACLNRSAVVSAHSFQGAEMHLKHVTLEDHTSLGCESVIFAGASMQERSHLGPLSACMMDEALLSGRYAGVPALRVR
eukprot:TRINITY_DN15525_c1_g1_i1.p1 TRINITY_DN15525_c1_g1~~TRINITY_DN15525_c1_g1_i1.p1  ORF type:complete len:1351 (-),score=243.25 TRINITY_DN15525_c1_g1_i1:86-4138(-)